ncbi:MAG: C-terminal binding protein [Verrucomicrobia bacterium]|nr:C-terminal binding protein [Verrucomicrobiota bacterium]
MAKFKVILIKHGYPNVEYERKVVTDAGGEFFDGDKLSEEEEQRICAEAEGILVRWRKITPGLIKTFRRCKIIVRYGVGTDNVDVDAATEAGIMVGHLPTYCLDEVSNHAIALWLACVRRVVRTHQKLAQGGWDANPPEPIHRTRGKTFGLVGFGNIAQAVARKLSGWGLRLLATDPFVDPARAQALGVHLVDQETLLQESDYLSLHVPLLPETRHLMSAPQFARMKPGVMLVNTARGPIVDAKALVGALETGRVAQAALDVFEEEPPPVNAPLRTHPRVILTDHVAWYSEESQIELKTSAAEEVVRVCTGGLPRSVANPEVLQRLGRLQEWTPNDTYRWQLKRLEKLRERAMPSA